MRVDLLTDTEAFAIERQLHGQPRLIWLIGCSTGLRVSDILRLQVYQLKKQRLSIKEQKTGKRRRLYIRRKIIEEVLQYQNENNLSDVDLLFNITRQGVWKAFKKAASLAGVQRNIGSHSMRKNYALAHIRKGFDLYDLKERLNHSHLSDTIGYITSNIDLGLDEKGKPRRKGRKRK